MTHVNYLLPNWNAPSHIHALTTLRTGGVSVGDFAGFNLASHVNDAPEAVQTNRELLKTSLKLPSEPAWLSQIHSNRVVEAQPSIIESADASFTSKSGVVCAVLTADCLPVILCSRDGEKIAAIHAGWKGLLAGILSNTVAALQTNDLLVWLGPAIGASCFEVGNEVREVFLAKNNLFTPAFLPKADKWLCDIYQLARIELIALGIQQISGGEFCTVCDSQRFYSYRSNPITGRMATLIWKD